MITFNTRELQRALKELAPAVGNAVISICDHVHCSIERNIASLRATNTHLDITVALPCESADMVLLLPFFDVFKPLSSLKGEPVTLELVSNKLKMVCGNERFSFSVEDVKAFPPPIELGEAVTIPVRDEFITAMQEASRHVSTNEMEVQYTGVGLFFSDNTCTIMATNQSKIFSASFPAQHIGRYHVPVMFTKAVCGAGELVLTENFIGLKQDGKETYMRLYDQKFINVLSLVKVDHEPNLTFFLSDLLPKLDIITSYGDISTVSLSFLGNMMEVSYVNKDFEREYTSSIDCVNSSSVDSITFNPSFLKSLLIAAGEDESKMLLVADNKPAYIFGDNKQMILSPMVNQ